MPEKSKGMMPNGVGLSPSHYPCRRLRDVYRALPGGQYRLQALQAARCVVRLRCEHPIRLILLQLLDEPGDDGDPVPGDVGGDGAGAVPGAVHGAGGGLGQGAGGAVKQDQAAEGRSRMVDCPILSSL